MSGSAEKRVGSIRRRIVLLVAFGMTVIGSMAMSRPVYAEDRAVDTVELGTPKHVWWETDTVGKWSSVSKAHEYQVKLYVADFVDRDEENWRTIDFEDESMTEAECVMSRRTSDTSCDFSEYMNDLHSYFFVVRATPKTSELAYVNYGDWTASQTVDFRGKTVQGITEGKWRNYLEGSKYEDGDGEFLPGGWQLIRGDWYLLDENGYRLLGWQERDGKRYYLSDTDGRMATGWIVWDDAWYYMAKDGSMQTGWIMDLPGKYYYLNADGTMAHDAEVDGYVLGSDGLRQ
ncbi:MAG: hypothetical protein PHV18_01390 [Lachnospiraceae bacterium]|nr:hypothetical protein [Lachnospiraceae bacterium]